MERWRNEEGGGSSDWPTFPAARGEQSRLGPQPCSTRLPPPSESCSQTIFVPAVKGSYLFWTQLVRGESTQSPFLPRVPLQLYNPPSVRHPGIKLSRKPQKVQETQHRKTEKGTGQAFLPSLGRQIHRRRVSWAEPEIADIQSLIPLLLSELRVPGLGDTVGICIETATVLMELAV